MESPFLLTVDVEPDWGVAGSIAVRQALPPLCDMLRRHSVRATFFIVSDLLGECGDLFSRELAGHEAASHGRSHRRLDRLPPSDVAAELSESRARLEAHFRLPVRGFRAPFLATPPGWVDMLAAAGYEYDSSAGSVAPSPRNVPAGKWRVGRSGGVATLPTTALRPGWAPFSLTWLRLLAPVGERLVHPRATMMYLHLHELADARLAERLPWPMRTLLRRNAGEAAWPILERTVARFASRAMTCSEAAGLL